MRADLFEPSRYLYHYTKWEKAARFIIPDRRLLLSPFSVMNDPMEFIDPTISAGFGYAPGDREASERFSQLHVETQEEIRRIRATHKLVCLSRDAPWVNDLREPDRRFGMGWARGRMWDQYADHHQGVCLVFDRDRLLPLVREQLSAHPGDFKEGAVQYKPTGINGTTAANIMLSATDTSTLLAKTHTAEYAEELFFTKLPDWKEEQEYRFAVSSNSPDHLYVNVGDSLVAFITGCKFSAATDQELVGLGDEQGVPAYAFFWEFNGPWCGLLTGYGTDA